MSIKYGQIKYGPRALSIGFKTLISHVMLCIFMISLASTLSYALSYRYIKEMYVDELTKQARQIAESSSHPEGGQITPPNRHLARIYEKLTESKVFFLDVDTEAIGMLRYRDDPAEDNAEEPQWIEVRDSIDREYVERILAGEEVSVMKHFEFAQGEIIFAGVPILNAESAVIGGVILAQPLTQLKSLSRMLRFLLTIVMGVSLLLAVVLAMELSYMLVKPIQRITRAARRMENGVYAERITNLPGDEIGELGHALNSMSGRLVEVIRNLREERDKLELVMSGIGEGLVAVNREWQLVRSNKAFLALTELDAPEDLLSHNKSMQPLRKLLERCMQGGDTEEMDWENASGRALHASASALKDERGEMLGTVCLLRDISEEQRMEQLRRDYVANISHELRTPLTGIRGMVEPLIDGYLETEEERQDSYRIILKETIRLEKLVGEMLDLSRLQDGRLRVELEPMELPGILEAAARSMSAIANEVGVSLRIETDGSRLACIGNEDRITQVLIILLDNALSFTPRGGSVVIFAREERDWVCVGVRDTGCGIEPKDLPLIWERFYKADKSRMRTTGTGLGLAIAKLVTRLMGGDITVKSEPGKGAEFTFTLKKYACCSTGSSIDGDSRGQGTGE